MQILKIKLVCLVVLVLDTISKYSAFSCGRQYGWSKPTRASIIKRNIHPMEIPCRNFAGHLDKTAPLLFYINYGPNAPNRCDESDIVNTSFFDRFRKPQAKEKECMETNAKKKMLNTHENSGYDVHEIGRGIA